MSSFTPCTNAYLIYVILVISENYVNMQRPKNNIYRQINSHFSLISLLILQILCHIKNIMLSHSYRKLYFITAQILVPPVRCHFDKGYVLSQCQKNILQGLLGQ